MPFPIRPISLTILWITTLGFSFSLEPSEADAQATMKRSAGSLSRGSGSRRGNSLGSQTRGHDSGMSGESTSSKPAFRSPDKDSDSDDESDFETEEEESGTESGTGANSDEEKDREADHAHRTLGRSCMYGARGEVIFRPAGSRCRGDAPSTESTDESKPRAGSGPNTPQKRKPLAATTRQAPSRSAHPGPASPTKSTTTRDSTEGRPRGSCIYGPRGRVIHAPAGVDCRR